MTYTLSNYEKNAAYSAYKVCETLLDTAWARRLWWEEPALWQALVVPVRIGRNAKTAGKAWTENGLCFDAQLASQSMALVGPTIRQGLQRCIIDYTDTPQEPLLDTLLEIWRPFCAPGTCAVQSA